MKAAVVDSAMDWALSPTAVNDGFFISVFYHGNDLFNLKKVFYFNLTINSIKWAASKTACLYSISHTLRPVPDPAVE